MINEANTGFMLPAAALVMIMTPGLAFFYGGLVKAKSVISMMMMSFGAIAVVGVLWVIYGYGVAFGSPVPGLEHFLGNPNHDLLLVLEFLDAADQRNHDLGNHLDALLRHQHHGFEDGARLHLGDLGIGDAEAAAAVAEHRVELVQILHALGDLVRTQPQCLRERLLRRVIVR